MYFRVDCGDDKSASGSATYQSGVYRQDLLPELSRTLERDTNCVWTI